jgi:hypothetical protein
MTPAAFFASFPEFQDTDAIIVAAKLQAAATRMGMAGDGINVWGPFAPAAAPGQPQSQTTADLAQGNLAAHYLVSSPFGTNMRLDPKSNGRSIYLDVFEDLMYSVCGGFAVAGITV